MTCRNVLVLFFSCKYIVVNFSSGTHQFASNWDTKNSLNLELTIYTSTTSGEQSHDTTSCWGPLLEAPLHDSLSSEKRRPTKRIVLCWIVSCQEIEQGIWQGIAKRFIGNIRIFGYSSGQYSNSWTLRNSWALRNSTSILCPGIPEHSEIPEC